MHSCKYKLRLGVGYLVNQILCPVGMKWLNVRTLSSTVDECTDSSRMYNRSVHILRGHPCTRKCTIVTSNILLE